MNFTNMEEYVKHINKIRLDNKNKWWFFEGTLYEQPVVIKGYNTWMQKYIVNGLNYSNPMEESVKDFKESLRLPFGLYVED